MEGRGFRVRAPEFEEQEAVILGASFDPPEANRAFARKQGFTFPLLSDVDRQVGELYGTKRHPGERGAEWPKRRTYLIDPDGVVRKAYRVKVIAAHPDEVLEDLKRLRA